MKIKALKNFAGLVNMIMGEVKDVDEAIAKDLIHAGYAEPEVQEAVVVSKKENTPTKKKKK